jgi:hypothetical protein
MTKKPESLIREYLSDHRHELVENHNIPISNNAIPFIINGELSHVVEYDSHYNEPILIEFINIVKPVYLSTKEEVENGE